MIYVRVNRWAKKVSFKRRFCAYSYTPIKAADNITLSIDNLVVDLYISAPPARDQLMVLLDKLPISHAVEVTRWNSFRPGSFREHHAYSLSYYRTH